MTWIALLALAAGTYALRGAGTVVLGRWKMPERARAVVSVAPAALLAALVVVQTFATGAELAVDARAVGVVAALALLALRAPFPLVVFGSVVVAAAVRAWL